MMLNQKNYKYNCKRKENYMKIYNKLIVNQQIEPIKMKYKLKINNWKYKKYPNNINHCLNLQLKIYRN